MSDSAVLTCLFSRVNGRFGAIPAFQPGAILPRVPGVQHVACESVGRVSQPRSNKPGCGGARLSGIRIVSIAGTVSSRWVSIFSMTTGSSIQAITLTCPPHSRQVSISMSPKAPTRCCPGHCVHSWCSAPRRVLFLVGLCSRPARTALDRMSHLIPN